MDIAAHKELIAVVFIDSRLEVYKNCELQRAFDGVHLPVRYNPSPGVQSFQYGRVFSLLDTGVLFLPYLSNGNHFLGCLDLENSLLPIHPLPGIKLASLVAYTLVPDSTVVATSESISK